MVMVLVIVEVMTAFVNSVAPHPSMIGRNMGKESFNLASIFGSYFSATLRNPTSPNYKYFTWSAFK